MKKLLVLLTAVAVAAGATAGVNYKIIAPTTKSSVKEAKANAMDRQTLTFKKGEAAVLPGMPLKAFNPAARTSNHAIKAGDTYFWNFEDEAQANDWTVLDEDGDGYGWEWNYDDQMVTQSGNGVMGSASYINDGNGGGFAITPDNWLVSPWVDLGGTFAFYACGQDPSFAAEVFAVYIYTDANSEWVKISDDMVATGTMKLYTVDLSEYEGLGGSLAIRHYNVTDQFRLNVDDITIGEFEEPVAPEAPEVITEIPEGCEVVQYYRNTSVIYSSLFGVGAGYADGKFTVAYAPDGTVYIKNPAYWYDGLNAWVKGTIEDGIISIPVGQYLSWYDDYQYGVQLGMGSTYVYEQEDPETGEMANYLGSEIDDRATEIQFMIDGEYIYLLGTEGDLSLEFPENFNAYGMYTYWSNDLGFTSIEFANVVDGETVPMGQIVNLVPAVPANPTADEWSDCGDESGFSHFDFTLPTTDVEGNMIDPEYLTYTVWINDGMGTVAPFVFNAETYSHDITEDMTEIPYSVYSGGYDFYKYRVYLYRTNAEGYEPLFVLNEDEHQYGNIGIQVFYTVPDENGVEIKNASEIVWLYPVHTSSVNELNAGKTVASVRYFNVAGQEMAQPSGMTIQVTTYTDGTTSAVKVVK